jgi:two-component system NtrC family response regulator
MDKPKILIVDDDETVRSQMKWALASEYDTLQAQDRPSCVEITRSEHPPVVTLDLGLPPAASDTKEGYLALSEMLQQDPAIKVIVVTGQGEKENALAAIRQGAYDFFSKPIDIDVLKVVIGRAIYVSELERENRDLQRRLPAGGFEGIIGTSSQMQAVFDAVRKVASTEAPVLISGESGTGKELAARAIHRLSRRKGGPFVAINCGAIPENLLESELFGHEKGAFTGAHIQREGRFEAAQQGTLFLDEIGELPPTLQVKLLRFLQEQVIERVGGRREIPVDTRVICATNADLRKAMSEGRFREDLYYRIGVVIIAIPPLRDRRGDIQLLATVLLERLAVEHKRSLNFSRKALDAIQAHPWPGNVREMENRLRRAVIMTEGSQITPADMELGGPYEAFECLGLVEARAALEKDLIQKSLAKNKGNLTRCAEELKISRPTLYELIEKLGIDRK